MSDMKDDAEKLVEQIRENYKGSVECEAWKEGVVESIRDVFREKDRELRRDKRLFRILAIVVTVCVIFSVSRSLTKVDSNSALVQTVAENQQKFESAQKKDAEIRKLNSRFVCEARRETAEALNHTRDIFLKKINSEIEFLVRLSDDTGRTKRILNKLIDSYRDLRAESRVVYVPACSEPYPGTGKAREDFLRERRAQNNGRE